MIQHGDNLKNEDAMITIEKTINDAFKSIGAHFEELLQEKIDKMKEQHAQQLKIEIEVINNV